MSNIFYVYDVFSFSHIRAASFAAIVSKTEMIFSIINIYITLYKAKVRVKI